MKTFTKALLLLAFASSVANAQDVFNDPASAGGSPILVSIFDNNRNVSLVYAIPGEFYQNLSNGSFTSFNAAIPEFDTIFGASASGDIQYTVAAIGRSDSGFPGESQAATFVTASGLPSLTNADVSGFDSIIASPYITFLRNTCGDDRTCSTDNPASPVFAGDTDWGTLSTQLGFSAASVVGSALNFYDITQTGFSEFPGFVEFRAGDAATVVDTLGVWLLDPNGTLTYSVVPLPAAAWLLLSGLFGFGAIARRRQQTA